MKKKLVALFLSCITFGTLLTACASPSILPQPEPESEVVSEVASIEDGSEIITSDQKENTVVSLDLLLNQDIKTLNAIAAKDNVIFSPVSLNTALNMYQHLSNDAEYNASISEFTNGINYLDYTYPGDTYKSVNRIWVNEINKTQVPDSDLTDLEYVMDMSDSQKATDEKNAFVNEQTNGFITKTPSVLNTDTVYDIMNILYFKDEYKSKLKKLDYEPVFNNEDGTESKPQFVKFNASSFYQNSTVTVVSVDYKNGNKLLLIKPNTSINAVNLTDIFEEETYGNMDVYFPLFSAENSFMLNDFAEEVFGKPAPVDIMQVAKIEVDENGTTAAAVTEMIKSNRIEPVEVEKTELWFDNPFYYAIEDTTNGDIAFIGRVSNFK